MGMISEFKAFAMRGNVVDMAIGVVIGAAFGKIVGALVDKMIMPIVGYLTSGQNFSELAFKLGTNPDGTPAVSIGYGAFLQSTLDPLGHLQLHFRRRRARPQGPHDHRLEREVRVLGAPELEIREHAGEHQHDDQVADQRAVTQRPVAEIGWRHGADLPRLPDTGDDGGSAARAASMTRTRSPPVSLWTPATTIRSPALAPPATIAVSSR